GRFSPPADTEPSVVAAADAPRGRARRPARSAPTAGTRRGGRRRTAPTRAAPLALALRAELDALRGSRPDPERVTLSRAARDVAAFLAAEGASFSADVAAAT